MISPPSLQLIRFSACDFPATCDDVSGPRKNVSVGSTPGRVPEDPASGETYRSGGFPCILRNAILTAFSLSCGGFATNTMKG